MDFVRQHEQYLARCEEALKGAVARYFLPDSQVSQAAEYALMNGGKRVRGVLALATAEMLGGDARLAGTFAAAIEMIHAFSLIHDDLPCMDDDDMRRGKPSAHIAYGEATALLAGDMLSIQAFEAIAGLPHDAPLLVRATGVLARAAGGRGMIYGQELDMRFENAVADAADVYRVMRSKTGALISAAAALGAVAAGAEFEGTALEVYAANVGCVFQIVDDILNETSTAEVMGKPVGNDRQRGKNTFVAVFGLEEARTQAARLTGEAVAALRGAHGDKAEFLCEYADNLAARIR